MLFSEKERKRLETAQRLEGFLLLGLALVALVLCGWGYGQVLTALFTKIFINLEAL